MFLKFFKGSKPSVFIAVILASLALWINPVFISPGEVAPMHSDAMPLFVALKWLLGGNLLLENLAAMLVVTGSAVYLILLNTRHILIKHRTYLPAFLFTVITSSFEPLRNLNTALLATPFLIWATDNLLASYESKSSLNYLFKAGFALGIGSLIYLPLSVFLIALYISLIILNFQHLRQFLVVTFGFITPVFFVFVYFFLQSKSLQEPLAAIQKSFAEKGEPTLFHGLKFTLFYSYIALVVLFALLYLANNLRTQKISVRKFFSLFIWLILFATTTSLVFSFSSIEMIHIGTFPAVFILAYFFTFARNRFWPDFLFSIIVLLSITLQFL